MMVMIVSILQNYFVWSAHRWLEIDKIIYVKNLNLQRSPWGSLWRFKFPWCQFVSEVRPEMQLFNSNKKTLYSAETFTDDFHCIFINVTHKLALPLQKSMTL